ncbi:MAG: class I SAM-dependent methyltransferase [Burkholderiales bacterium]|jgi:hypothetical protein|nr:class I SAM-dependent methyltransferase [Burkholderiales bacterium]
MLEKIFPRKNLSVSEKKYEPGQATKDIKAAFPPGHFYSPIVDPGEININDLWPDHRRPIFGIDFNETSHKQILKEDFPRFIGEYDYPEKESQTSETHSFFTQNGQFSWLDSRLAFVLLRKWNPRHFIEVGSGFSSLLIADINKRFFNSNCDIVCIDPYPRDFLKKGVPGISSLIEAKVQDVPLSLFEKIHAGDVLFIDSSHVSKTGSDVNYLYFEVLPRLREGVIIHIHDVFLPNEYLKGWVIEENRSWNEQYVLRALLMYSSAFRVIFGSAYAYSVMPDLLSEGLRFSDRRIFGGGSFWIKKLF